MVKHTIAIANFLSALCPFPTLDPTSASQRKWKRSSTLRCAPPPLPFSHGKCILAVRQQVPVSGWRMKWRNFLRPFATWHATPSCNAETKLQRLSLSLPGCPGWRHPPANERLQLGSLPICRLFVVRDSGAAWMKFSFEMFWTENDLLYRQDGRDNTVRFPGGRGSNFI